MYIFSIVWLVIVHMAGIIYTYTQYPEINIISFLTLFFISLEVLGITMYTIHTVFGDHV